ncbi:calcium-binding protein 8 [Gopherus flavomarginatus]|uniref:calcium-binding protein 8 n=1 Tax=Gopherus flavomarginatus TaxID=286002 RepID=UPI0021CC0F22|nr:calcium-binding protein 8 [Gopherus flavomarginatus]
MCVKFGLSGMLCSMVASGVIFLNMDLREKMPFHHVTAGLLYKGNYLNRSLSAGSDSEQLANISVEELDEIREAFRVLDRDGNGFISKQELGMAMRSLGYMPSEVELAIIMQRLDMDGDGQVDFDEFMTILGPKLVSSEGRDGFLGNTIDSIFWQNNNNAEKNNFLMRYVNTRANGKMKSYFHDELLNVEVIFSLKCSKLTHSLIFQSEAL